MPKKLKIKVVTKKTIVEIEENSSSDEEVKEECSLISQYIPDIDNIYLMRRGNTNSYKIGYSNDPMRRLKDL